MNQSQLQYLNTWFRDILNTKFKQEKIKHWWYLDDEKKPTHYFIKRKIKKNSQGICPVFPLWAVTQGNQIVDK